MKQTTIYYLPGDATIPDDQFEGMFLSTGECSPDFKEWIKKYKKTEKYTLDGFAAAFNSDYISDQGYIFAEEKEEI